MNKKQKNNSPLIAHVIYRLDTGGLENGLVNIINRLPRGQFKHAIICLTDYTDFRKRLEPKVEVIALHKKPGHDIGLYWRLFKVFRRLQPDIVHTRNLAALEAQVPAWLAGVKYRIHGLHGWDISDISGDSKRYQRLYRLINPLIHRYIPLSNELEDYLIQKIGVKAAKISKICNGVDTDRFFPRAPQPGPLSEGEGMCSFSLWEKVGMRERAKPPVENWADDSHTIIGSVGRLEPVKDQVNLVNAFIYLIEHQPSLKDRIRLILVGDGSLRPEIEQIIEKAGVGEMIWLAGSQENIPDLMREMDLFVLPSKAEGISNTILEAMATGLPVVATDVGGNAELIEPDKTGSLVPKEDSVALAEALYEYISQPGRLAEHSIAARQRAVERFSLNKMVGEYQKVYQNR